MNKNMDQKKVEAPILLEKNSSCYVSGPKALQSLLKFKGLKQQDLEDNLNSDSNIKYTIHVFCLIKSRDIDGGKEWHYDYHDEKKVPTNENGFMTGFRSAHNFNGRDKLVSTCGLMFMINIQKMESSQFEKFAADIKNYDSETQIKMLKKAGYKKFTVQLSNKCDGYDTYQGNWSRVCLMSKKLELVDENGEHVDYLSEYYCDPRGYEETDDNGNYISDRSEYINPAHMPFIHRFDKNEELSSIIILNKNAKMEHYNEESPFCEVENKNPLTFYCEPGSEIAIDILSKCRDEEKYPEFYNATIVFMSPKLVADYQKNLDDLDNYIKMNEFIKSYKEKQDYFSFKLPECSNRRIEQLLFAQKYFSDTWEKFVEFMENIEVKEKSDVKDVEFTYENEESNTEIKKANEKRDNNTDEPEEKLNIFMRYLKNHWPRIFKFVNAVCNFFSSLKNKFNNNNKSNLRDIVDNINPKQSLIDKTSNLSSQKKIVNRPDNMENQLVSDILQQK